MGLWDEEIKCLFLRTRNPTKNILDELIKNIFNMEPYTDEATNILKKTQRSFTDFRNKYNDQLLKLVEEFNNKQNR
jgi:hypothetical protein